MRKINYIVAVATVLVSAIGFNSSVFAANNATLTVTAPTSLEVGKPQDLTIKLTTGGNKIDTVVLAGSYTADVADISFAVATGSTNLKNFMIQKPTIDKTTGLFSATLSSLTDTLSTDGDIVKVTVTPKKAGNFSFKLTQGGEQGTQVILTNSATNILATTNGITPASTDITVVGDNSTVTTTTPSVTNTPLVESTETPVVDSGATSTGTVDSTTTDTAPKSGPAETFALLALMFGVLAFVGYRKLSAE